MWSRFIEQRANSSIRSAKCIDRIEESRTAITETLTPIFLKDIHVCRTLIWLVGRVVGLLIQPACRSQTDVPPANACSATGTRVLQKNPETSCCYLVSHPPADLPYWACSSGHHVTLPIGWWEDVPSVIADDGVWAELERRDFIGSARPGLPLAFLTGWIYAHARLFWTMNRMRWLQESVRGICMQWLSSSTVPGVISNPEPNRNKQRIKKLLLETASIKTHVNYNMALCWGNHLKWHQTLWSSIYISFSLVFPSSFVPPNK